MNDSCRMIRYDPVNILTLEELKHHLIDDIIDNVIKPYLNIPSWIFINNNINVSWSPNIPDGYPFSAIITDLNFKEQVFSGCLVPYTIEIKYDDLNGGDVIVEDGIEIPKYLHKEFGRYLYNKKWK